MSTTSLTSAERFDAEYPEELEDRLAWLERRLRVSRGRILRLMGVSDADGHVRRFHAATRGHDRDGRGAVRLTCHPERSEGPLYAEENKFASTQRGPSSLRSSG